MGVGGCEWEEDVGFGKVKQYGINLRLAMSGKATSRAMSI